MDTIKGKNISKVVLKYTYDLYYCLISIYMMNYSFPSKAILSHFENILCMQMLLY